jgi:hypothetical protein
MSRLVLFVGSIGWGTASYAIAWFIGPQLDPRTEGDSELAFDLAFWTLLALLGAALAFARSVDSRLTASGILIGFTGALVWATPRIDFTCGNLFSYPGCLAPDGSIWTLTLLIAFGVACALIINPAAAWVKDTGG